MYRCWRKTISLHRNCIRRQHHCLALCSKTDSECVSSAHFLRSRKTFGLWNIPTSPKMFCPLRCSPTSQNNWQQISKNIHEILKRVGRHKLKEQSSSLYLAANFRNNFSLCSHFLPFLLRVRNPCQTPFIASGGVFVSLCARYTEYTAIIAKSTVSRPFLIMLQKGELPSFVSFLSPVCLATFYCFFGNNLLQFSCKTKRISTEIFHYLGLSFAIKHLSEWLGLPFVTPSHSGFSLTTKRDQYPVLSRVAKKTIQTGDQNCSHTKHGQTENVSKEMKKKIQTEKQKLEKEEKSRKWGTEVVHADVHVDPVIFVTQFFFSVTAPSTQDSPHQNILIGSGEKKQGEGNFLIPQLWNWFDAFCSIIRLLCVFISCFWSSKASRTEICSSSLHSKFGV